MILTKIKMLLFSIFWIFPQYFVLTVGEVLFSITSLEFAYTQVNSKKQKEEHFKLRSIDKPTCLSSI